MLNDSEAARVVETLSSSEVVVIIAAVAAAVSQWRIDEIDLLGL